MIYVSMNVSGAFIDLSCLRPTGEELGVMKVPGESSSRVEFNDNFLLFLNFILIISFD